MRIAIPISEALHVAASAKPLPPMITSVRADGACLHTEIDLQAIADPSLALRLAAAAAGTVDVTARFAGFAGGIATLVVTAHARGLPAHKLVPYLLGPLNAALRSSGLPDGLIEIRDGDPDPLLLIDIQRAVDARANGITITSIDLRDADLHTEVRFGELRMR